MLGTSISFCAHYLTVDVLEELKHYWDTTFNRKTAKQVIPLLITHVQQYLLLAMSVTTGMLYGTIFAIIDIEDLYKRLDDLIFMMTCTEVLILGPLGVMLGAFSAVMFITLRILEINSRQAEFEAQEREQEDEEAHSLLNKKGKDGKATTYL